MYVSQVPATVIYTIFKTLLLIMIARSIESICSWARRYDLAKVLEKGSYPVLYTSIFTYKNYRNYWTLPMVALLLFILAIETASNLLPTIATNYMPFQSVSFTQGDSKYFKYMYNTSAQAARIPSLEYSVDNPMKNYCEDMNLCKNGIYDTHVLEISPTMQVEAIPYDYGEQKFITDYVNVSTPFCLPDTCPGTTAYFSTNVSGHTVLSSPGLPSDIVTYYSPADNSDYGTETIFNASRMNVQYDDSNGNPVSEAIDTSSVISMLYRPTHNDIISVMHLSKILFTNGRETVLLVLKVALHNICYQSPIFSKVEDAVPLFGDTFNNTALLFNITGTYDRGYYNASSINFLETTVAYTSYVTDDYFSVDINQRTLYYDLLTALKARLLFSVYVITDSTLPINSDSQYKFKEYLTNYNTTRSEHLDMSQDNFTMREPGFYDSMFDGFNEPPTDDLFMYAILDSSSHTLFGKEGYQDIVADISPVFVGVVCAILFVALVTYAISRYCRDPLYFYTLYQTIGHVDVNGYVKNPDGVIPEISVKDRTVYYGDKILVSKENMDVLKHPEADDTSETL
ncbi:hypothetical protein BJV82DRAFT_181116 [Fennellomyces sp. T-0311]|nr:hypothetical protein BJV82DRAFT_181116 [Fennellomyces sp. T-0311]